MRRVIGRLLALGVLAGAAAACAPVIRSHGYTPVPEQLARVESGVDTRGSVQRKIGRPAMDGLFASGETWYYVSSTVREESYKAPRVIDRKVVAVRFDGSGLVTGVNSYGMEDGRVIDLATRTTPTHGSQLSILQQLFGNIGASSGETLLSQ